MVRSVGRRVRLILRSPNMQWLRRHASAARRRPSVLVTLGLIGILGVLALLLGPLSEWAAVGADALKGKERADVINTTRQTLLAAAGGTAALIGLGFTARTFYLSRRGQFTDRYSKAITQLASDKTTERLGGVYALEHLMIESERDHATVVEVLAAFIRERTDDKRGMFPQHEHVHNGPRPAYRTLAIDIQAALTALGRRPQRQERNEINLIMADLCGADLANLRLDGVNFWGAKLRDVIMHNVQLRRANLSRAQMQDSRMGGAQLQGAALFGAKMQKVTLDGADLSEARLNEADLRGSNFGDANLRDADMGGTDLRGASFFDRRTNRQYPAKGLTWHQLIDAKLDLDTLLPVELTDQLIQRQRQRLYLALLQYRHLRSTQL